MKEKKEKNSVKTTTVDSELLVLVRGATININLQGESGGARAAGPLGSWSTRLRVSSLEIESPTLGQRASEDMQSKGHVKFRTQYSIIHLLRTPYILRTAEISRPFLIRSLRKNSWMLRTLCPTIICNFKTGFISYSQKILQSLLGALFWLVKPLFKIGILAYTAIFLQWNST